MSPIIGSQFSNPEAHRGWSKSIIRKNAAVLPLDSGLNWSSRADRVTALESGNIGTISLDEVIALQPAGGTKQLTPIEEAYRRELQEAVEELLGTLKPREREVLELRYGFSEHGTCLNLREIGELFGLTGETIRQIEQKALGRLSYRDWRGHGVVKSMWRGS